MRVPSIFAILTSCDNENKNDIINNICTNVGMIPSLWQIDRNLTGTVPGYPGTGHSLA